MRRYCYREQLFMPVVTRLYAHTLQLTVSRPQMGECGVTSEQLELQHDALSDVVTRYTREAGVRQVLLVVNQFERFDALLQKTSK